ncbi:MAG: hypothetical protein M1335_07030 [Chloroflexi bacterium]|nr:hypothetical protein [Chloroflexota bacterium]
MPEFKKPVEREALPEGPTPRALSNPVAKAIVHHGDQAKSAEVHIDPDMTVTLGHRNVYFHAAGKVAAVACVWHDEE